jgi:hypothetical protein
MNRRSVPEETKEYRFGRAQRLCRIWMSEEEEPDGLDQVHNTLRGKLMHPENGRDGGVEGKDKKVASGLDIGKETSGERMTRLHESETMRLLHDLLVIGYAFLSIFVVLH